MGFDDWLWWLKACAYVALASLGGVLGYIMRTLDKPNEKIRYRRAMVEGIASGFVGLLFMLLCNAMGLSDQWTGIIVGVAGWLGANVSIVLLEAAVRKKIGLAKKDLSNDELSQ